MHDKVAVYTERLLVQRFSEKVCVLQFGQHVNYLKLLPFITFPNEVVANIDVLRARAGGWVVGQMRRTYAVLLNHSAHHIVMRKHKAPEIPQEN